LCGWRWLHWCCEGRAGFTLSRALFGKKCGARHLGRQTLFFLGKNGDLFYSHHRPCVSCQFSWKTGDLFLVVTAAFIHFTRSLVCRPLFPACKKVAAPFMGAPFCGAPVRPNMLNMPKSAAVCRSTRWLWRTSSQLESATCILATNYKTVKS